MKAGNICCYMHYKSRRMTWVTACTCPPRLEYLWVKVGVIWKYVYTHPLFEELQSSLPIGVCISRRLRILYYVVCNVCHVVVPTKSVSLHAVVSKKHCVAALRDGLWVIIQVNTTDLERPKRYIDFHMVAATYLRTRKAKFKNTWSIPMRIFYKIVA